MATLNITFGGISADYLFDLDYELADKDVRRIAVEVVRNGEVQGLKVPNLPDSAFNDFVVDRFNTPEGGRRLYLRPKVPFGNS
jgi:hypothetical protein